MFNCLKPFRCILRTWSGAQQLLLHCLVYPPSLEGTARLLDDHRVLDPPDPIPNSAVKRYIADGSVGPPHVRVGHRQALIEGPRSLYCGALILSEIHKNI